MSSTEDYLDKLLRGVTGEPDPEPEEPEYIEEEPILEEEAVLEDVPSIEDTPVLEEIPIIEDEPILEDVSLFEQPATAKTIRRANKTLNSFFIFSSL